MRFSQDLVLAINPATGLPYNVIHANNLADPMAGNGTFENPYATLAEAEAGSAVNDIIFVDGGDGTDNGYDAGITLKDNQYLLSNGGNQFVPLPDGSQLLLSGKPGASKATISNDGGNEVVRLANNNVVGGLNIDATGANFGIRGIGVTDGAINGNMISNATLDGIGLQNISGDWLFTDNMINNNLRDGIFVNGNFDSTSTFTFDGNDVSNNAFDGIHIRNYDAQLVQLFDNVTNENGRHGVFLENALNGAGTGNDILIFNHESDLNGSDGIFINNGNGNLAVFNPTLTNQTGGVGLRIRNWTNTLPGDATVIAGLDNTEGFFSGNATGISIELEGAGLTQDVLVTQSRVDNNGRGMLASVDGLGSVMNFNVIDMTSISNNDSEAIRMLVDGGGTLNNLIESTSGISMPIINNNAFGGGSISYALNGAGGDPPSEINSIVRNVNVNTSSGAASAIQVDGFGNSTINLFAEDSTLQAGTGINISLDNINEGNINQTYFDDLIIRADVGVLGSSVEGTNWDFALSNSDIQSNGLLANGELLDRTNPGAYTPYTDTLGANGVVITAQGESCPLTT